ncbi:MAG: zinc ribbon domain-containing protein [Lachnospiraceae bacterium]|nr:zinc ribbon domain-containing protein [Lachnospiraceae bacterium]
MFCTNCGTNLKDDARFCVNCGQPVKVRAQSQEAAPAPAPAPQPMPFYQAAPATEAAPETVPQPQAAPVPQPAPMPQYNEQAIPPVGQGYVPERAAEEKPAKKKKFPVWIPIVGGVVLVGLAVLLLLLFGAKQKINMNDYVKVKFDGYDTIGKAEASFDTKAFRKAFDEKLKWKKKAYEEQYGSPVDFLIKIYTGALSKTEGLKNGEKVTYKWNLSEEFPKDIMNANISAEDCEVEVEGLEEVEVFDPFKDLEVVFDGVNGYGYVKEIHSSPENDEYGLYVYPEDFNVQYDHKLSNGDEIVVKIMDEDDKAHVEFLAEAYGIIPSALSKTIVVSGLEEVEAFDPFEDLEVSFTGFNGRGRLELENKSELEACKYLYFEADKDYELSNGDEIRVFFDFDDDDRAEWADVYGMIPAYTEKTYVVSGLERYATSYEEIKDVVDDMYDFMKGKLEEEYADRGQYGFSLEELSYTGYYFMKDDPSDDDDMGNMLYMVIREIIGSDTGEKKECWTVVMFYDVKCAGDEPVFDPDDMTIRYYAQNKIEITSTKAKMTLSAFDDLEGTRTVLDTELSLNKGLVFESSDIMD